MSIAVPVVPAASPLAADSVRQFVEESFRTQRSHFFRPWYVDQTVAFVNPEAGQVAYADLLATSVTSRDSVEGPEADLTFLDGLPAEPLALRSLTGTLVVTQRGTDPHFAEKINSAFPDRTVEFLHQGQSWPGNVRAGRNDDATVQIAVIDGPTLPTWPRLGFVVPCAGEVAGADLAISRLAIEYPGELEIALVAQGCNAETLEKLKSIADAAPHVVHLLEEHVNLGFAQGANRGLDFLWQESWFDYFGVCHDDAVPAPDTLGELIAASQALTEAGQRVGLIAPMSNVAEGVQQVETPSYNTVEEMGSMSLAWAKGKHSNVVATPQVRGPLFLISNEALNAIGGFDPQFGSGNFTEHDYSLRCRLAGHDLWVCPGAFVHHAGGVTYRALDLDPEDGLIRDLALFLEKWNVDNVGEAMDRLDVPDGLVTFQSLTARPPRSGHLITINGFSVDLVHEASEFDLAAWIVTKLRDKPREARIAVLEALDSTGLKA